MKKLLCVGLNILMVAALVSCNGNSGPGGDEFKPILDTNTSCKIRIVGDYKKFEALEAEFHRFRYFYPHVSFSYTELENYKSSIADHLNGSNKPNIFFTYSYMVGNSNYDAVFEHAEDLSDSNLKINFDCIRDGLIHKEADNKIYMVPVFARTYGMLVNNDLFEKEGLEVPTTYEELGSVCESFIEKGYVSPLMGYTAKSSSSLMNTIAYPMFVSSLAGNQEALNLANNLDSNAGPYTREALETVSELITNGYVNLEECDKIKDNYAEVIFRFFEGDVPMMACTADTASGTTTRESSSEAFVNSPFEYSFAPIPTTSEGGYFIDSPSVEFSVNKNCENLDMTNEFIRFLITDKELNEMSTVKGLLTPTKVVSFDSLYAPFASIPEQRIISSEALGIKDALANQIREASFKVGKSQLTVDEAVSRYGSF